MRNISCFVAVLALVLNVACGKAEEKTVEQVMEQVAEANLGDGSEVDLSEEGMEVTSQDEDGTYTWKAGDKAEIPETFPDDVFIYEGAEIPDDLGDTRKFRPGPGHR